MLLRRSHELAGLFRDGRKRAGWSQSEFAERIGASRQWVSLVENGKVSAEFDLVLAGLQALGYALFVEPDARPAHDVVGSVPASTDPLRTPLTRAGRPLRPGRARRPPAQDVAGQDGGDESGHDAGNDR